MHLPPNGILFKTVLTTTTMGGNTRSFEFFAGSGGGGLPHLDGAGADGGGHGSDPGGREAGIVFCFLLFLFLLFVSSFLFLSFPFSVVVFSSFLSMFGSSKTGAGWLVCWSVGRLVGWNSKTGASSKNVTGDKCGCASKRDCTMVGFP